MGFGAVGFGAGGFGAGGFGEWAAVLTEAPERPEQGSERWEQPPSSAGERGAGRGWEREKLIIREAESPREARESSSGCAQPAAASRTAPPGWVLASTAPRPRARPFGSSCAPIQMCGDPAVRPPRCAGIQLCAHPAGCASSRVCAPLGAPPGPAGRTHSRVGAHLAGRTAGAGAHLDLVHLWVGAHVRMGAHRGAQTSSITPPGGWQGCGYLAGLLARLHGPHVLVQLLAQLLQLLLQQHLRGQDGAVGGDPGTALCQRDPRCHPQHPPRHPPATRALGSAAYLDGLSSCWGHHC